MTARTLVRRYFPHASDSECDRILWKKTSFPFRPDILEDQLRAIAPMVPVFCSFEGNGNRLTGRGMWRVVKSPGFVPVIPGAVERIGGCLVVWAKKDIKPGTIVSPRKINREFWRKS